MNFSTVILAGGKSSRMGRDKAFLEIAGQTLLARQIGLARELGATEIFISGRNDVDDSTFGCRVLEDKFSNAGPLAGIERALAATTSPMLLVLAVDLPEMSSNLLSQLAASCSETCGTVPKLATNIEPLAAFYPKTSHDLAVTSLERGDFAAKDFAELCAQSGLVRFVQLAADDACHFANWNTPADVTSASMRACLTP